MGGKILLRWCKDMLEVEDCLSENRWYHHEERELREVFLAIAKEQSCGDGGT